MRWWKALRVGMDMLSYDPAHLLGEVGRVERLTPSESGVGKEDVGLGEREVVQGWLLELVPGVDHQIFVHREWGTVAVVADEESVGVFWTDGHSSWSAMQPGAAFGEPLTPQQIEQIVLDATTSSGPPQWPDWDPLWGPASNTGCLPRRRSARTG